VIERNARAQTRLIEDLLDMARINSGQMRLDMQPVRPEAFIEAAWETVRPAAEAKAIQLRKLFDPKAPLILGDPNRLQQVVWNVLANAIKFTPSGGKVYVLLERVNSHIEINVADTGIGMPPEFVPHIFDRFRQADASTTRAHGGLGIGLSIAKHLVELHGGIMRAHSAGEGEGATFTIELPFQSAQPAAPGTRRGDAALRAVPASFVPPDLSGLTVLAVDDQRDARELVKRILEDCGARVVTAAGAREALALVRRQKPDLLISDIGMPEMDGFELLRELRAMHREGGADIPAIALTAFARSEDRTRALRAGFRMHVSKPVEPTELMITVANVAGRAAG
jgi:CheY-like chemotaxis protein